MRSLFAQLLHTFIRSLPRLLESVHFLFFFLHQASVRFQRHAGNDCHLELHCRTPVPALLPAHYLRFGVVQVKGAEGPEGPATVLLTPPRSAGHTWRPAAAPSRGPVNSRAQRRFNCRNGKPAKKHQFSEKRRAWRLITHKHTHRLMDVKCYSGCKWFRLIVSH